MRKEEKQMDFIKCECGYNNKPYNVKTYGTCTGCGKVLDKQSKFRYDMYNKLKLWKGKRWY